MAGEGYEVTDAIARLGGTSYPLAAISSLRIGSNIRIGTAIVAGFIAFLCFALTPADGGAAWTIGGFGFAFGAAGALVPEHTLYIRTAGGETAAFTSRKKATLVEIRKAIESKIAARG